MPVTNTAIEDLSFEKAFAELETIIGALEAGQASLEESLALFERGQALAQRCASLLDNAELRVRQLNGYSPDTPGNEDNGK